MRVVPAGSPRHSRGAGAGRVWPAVVPGRAAQRHTHWNAPRAQRRASGCARRWQGERDAPALSHVPVPIFVCRMWRHTVTLGACGCVPWMRGWGGARETERPSCVVCVWLDESSPPPCVHGLAHVCSRERLYIDGAGGSGCAWYWCGGVRSGACAPPHAELYRARESVCGPRTSKLMNIQHSHNTDHTCHRTPQAGSCVCHTQNHPASGIDADARNAPSLPPSVPHASRLTPSPHSGRRPPALHVAATPTVEPYRGGFSPAPVAAVTAWRSPRSPPCSAARSAARRRAPSRAASSARAPAPS